MGNILPIRTGDGPDDPLAYEHPDDVPATVQIRPNKDFTFSVLEKPEHPGAAQAYVESLRRRVASVCGASVV